MYYVYLIKSKNSDKLYLGYTNNLKRRLQEHNRGVGGKYTKFNFPLELIYYEAYKSENDAKQREERLKLHKRAYAQLKKRIKKSLDN